MKCNPVAGLIFDPDGNSYYLLQFQIKTTDCIIRMKCLNKRITTQNTNIHT